ncbi:MAG: DUF853 family protein, partial [Actinobacteria bacterium]|nr:DUF853 family protein [Actinomycetota bacterium]
SMRPPSSRMAPADDVDAVAKGSPLWAKYGNRVDAQSAREMLAGRLQPPAAPAAKARPTPTVPAPTAQHKQAGAAIAGGAAVLGQFLNSRQGKAVQRDVVRGFFGLLKKSR